MVLLLNMFIRVRDCSKFTELYGVVIAVAETVIVVILVVIIVTVMTLVMIIIVFLKLTTRPLLSVNLPSSNTCNKTLNTSGCAFSISSKSTIE